MFLTKVWSNELGGDLVFIDELWVARERRSRGVGTALVEHGIATTKGAVAFELEVTKTNARARARLRGADTTAQLRRRASGSGSAAPRTDRARHRCATDIR